MSNPPEIVQMLGEVLEPISLALEPRQVERWVKEESSGLGKCPLPSHGDGIYKVWMFGVTLNSGGFFSFPRCRPPLLYPYEYLSAEPGTG